MKRIIPFCIVAFSLMALSCSPSPTLQDIASNGAVPVTAKEKRIVKVQPDNELVAWQQAIARESEKLVASGRTDLKEVVDMVSRATLDLEPRAREAYIRQQIELHSALEGMAMQQIDEDFRELYQQAAPVIKENQTEIFDREFERRKIMLIEKHFSESRASQ